MKKVVLLSMMWYVCIVGYIWIPKASQHCPDAIQESKPRCSHERYFDSINQVLAPTRAHTFILYRNVSEIKQNSYRKYMNNECVFACHFPIDVLKICVSWRLHYSRGMDSNDLPLATHLNPITYTDPNIFNPWRWKVCKIIIRK